jgi:hypothetical protein
MSGAMMNRTTQLRRYTLNPEHAAAFFTWWQDRIVPVRLEYGFTIEFAYFEREGMDFVWAVSLEGDTDEFMRVEHDYTRSKGRMLALDGVPPWTTNQHIALVDPVGFLGRADDDK